MDKEIIKSLEVCKRMVELKENNNKEFEVIKNIVSKIINNKERGV